MLEEEFYKLVTPEGKQNYMLEGQAKILLLLCQAVDKLVAAQQTYALDGAYCTHCECNTVYDGCCTTCMRPASPRQ